MMGKAVFVLDVRAQLTDEERRSVSTYKFGKALLYSKEELADSGKGLLGLASRLAFHAMNISVTVDDLANGKITQAQADKVIAAWEKIHNK